MESIKEVSGRIVFPEEREIIDGHVLIQNGHIKEIRRDSNVPAQYILPGFIDAHIHIESSMLTPYEFAKIALRHGTVATVSDPHEIANVLGIEGVFYMIENAKDARLKFHFGAPSCVPATSFENSGAIIDADAVYELLLHPDIWYLSEMMNFPGVLNSDPEVLKKLHFARMAGKPIDGHAPGLTGEDALKYIKSGISTDHECFSYEEALFKLQNGMKVIIREGSAAKNYRALSPLIGEYAPSMMFCSDDKHPDDLMEGHINMLVKRALDDGFDLFDVLLMACINPVRHYGLPVGTLRRGDPADFIVMQNLYDGKVEKTVINGKVVYQNGNCNLSEKKHPTPNNFFSTTVSPEDFYVRSAGTEKEVWIINAIDGQLITEKSKAVLKVLDGNVTADDDRDILKISVINRYKKNEPAVAFIKNFGLKNAAIASSVAHDSHNIVVVGSSEHWMAKAVNLLMNSRGGLSVVSENAELSLALPIAGLMSDKTAGEVAYAYSELDQCAKSCGCTLHSPFMTLSFMALLVIPKIKISDMGLFDAERFEFIR